MESIDLTFSAADLADLALQRTAALITLGGGDALVAWFANGDKSALIALLSRPAVAEAFIGAVVHEVEREVALLAQHVDLSAARSLTSIGSGLCILELLLYRRQRSRLYLIDIERSDEHQHGYNPTGSGYSNNATARAFLERNGIAKSDISFCNPRLEPLNDEPVDVILSSISMGFHYPVSEYVPYPVSEYVPYIERALPVNGLLIFDKRKGILDPGWDMLGPKFKTRAILDSEKYQKLVCERYVR